MLWTLAAVFLILWLLGFSMSIGGGLTFTFYWLWR